MVVVSGSPSGGRMGLFIIMVLPELQPISINKKSVRMFSPRRRAHHTREPTADRNQSRPNLFQSPYQMVEPSWSRHAACGALGRRCVMQTPRAFTSAEALRFG